MLIRTVRVTWENMDSEFLSGSYRSLLAVDLGRDVGTVLLCLGHYVAAVRGERNSLVHLFLSLENGISGDFFKKMFYVYPKRFSPLPILGLCTRSTS